MLDRNFLRTQVLPQVRQRWPSYAHGVQRSVDDLSAQRALLMHYRGKRVTRPPFSRFLRPPSLPLSGCAGTWPIAVNLVFPTLHYTSCCASGRILIEAISTLARLVCVFGGTNCISSRCLNLVRKGCLRFLRRCRCKCYGTNTNWIWHRRPPARSTPLRMLAASGDLSRFAECTPGRCRRSTEARRFQLAGIPPWRRGQYPLLWDDIGLFCIPQIWQRADTQLSAVQTCKYCVVRSAPNSD